MMERKDSNSLTAYYANMMQLLVLLVDSNRMVIEAGRATGKTRGVTGPRTIRVAGSMPGETAGFGHSTYIRLMSIIVPELISFYKSAADASGRPLMREGIDFVYGEKDLPRHFCRPRYPILHPEHSIVFANGFNIRLVSTDQPDSIAGANIVHFFFEEMKHSDGEKVRSRIFPAMRVGRLDASGIHKSPYYGGFTGVSDTARVTLGEDAWFTKYAGQMDRRLVEDIIKLSRLDESDKSIMMEDVELYQLCKDVEGQLMLRAKERNVQLNVDGQMAVVHGARQILYEMVYNLCDNAIKYNKADGKVKISVGYNKERHPVIRVEDTGIGIPKEEQERIFERFYRVDKSHSRATGGTGLGLSIVKHGAILHDAKIEVDSTPEVGTSISVIFGENSMQSRV